MCTRPLPAWRTKHGAVIINKEFQAGATFLEIPCSQCTACLKAHALAWALRCTLEFSQHHTAAFTTLTYDNTHKPLTLSKPDLQLWLKRLRAKLARSKPARTVRFFASGEYGPTTRRPHYHALLFGLHAKNDANLIEDTWGLGHTRSEPVTARRISYVAGYTDKKHDDTASIQRLRLDPTGTHIYRWQPPFLQMSRNPGIGGNARNFTESWRLYAIHANRKIPVPRYLHNAWKQQATEEQLQQLENEKQNTIRYTTYQERQAREAIAIKNREIQQQRRQAI